MRSRRDGRPRSVKGVVSIKPIWRAGVEQPVFTRFYPEGKMAYYGTGLVVVELLELPILIRLRVAYQGLRPTFFINAKQRRSLAVALRKITAEASAKAAGGSAPEDSGDFPTLIEYLTATTYPTGEKRETSTLVIVCDQSGWRGCLSDRDNLRSLWKTSGSVLGLLVALEEAAAGDDPTVWRQQQGYGQKGKRKT